MTEHEHAGRRDEPSVEGTGTGGAPVDGSGPDDAPVDAAALLALIADQQQRARDAAGPDSRLLFGLWGLAWLIGYGVLALTGRQDADGTPAPWAFVLFAALIAAAVVVTAVHSIRRGAGTVGPSNVSGTLFGLSWPIGFVGMSLLLGGVARAGASDQVMALLSNAVACLLVGLIYLGGGAMWQSRVLYLLGTWVLLLGAVSTFAGTPGQYVVLALAGGGGFLVGALVEHLRRRAAAGGVPRPAVAS